MGLSELDPLLVLTDRHQVPNGDLVRRVGALVAAGVTTVVVREKDLDDAARAELAAALVAVVPVLLVASTVALARRIGAAGVHLAAADPGLARTDADALGLVVGRSAHDAASVAAAEAEGCDYVTLSPVFATASKPGYGPPLGADGFAAARGRGPAYALGGITTGADARAARAAGAFGVAVMGAAMRTPEPAALVAEMREAWA